MLNEEIYKALLALYGKEKMEIFIEIVRQMFYLRIQDPPPKQDDVYDLHYWSLKDINQNINTNEDGTDRKSI